MHKNGGDEQMEEKKEQEFYFEESEKFFKSLKKELECNKSQNNNENAQELHIQLIRLPPKKSHNNPFIRKKRKPAIPIFFIHFL